MTGFIVSVFPFRNRVSSKEAFEGLELGERKLSRPALRGPGGRKVAWLLGNQRPKNGIGRSRRNQKSPAVVFLVYAYSAMLKWATRQQAYSFARHIWPSISETNVMGSTAPPLR
jgi:hypothetical protein